MPYVDYTEDLGDDAGKSITWVLRQGETGRPYKGSRYADKTCHVFGTFGGATVSIRGSSDKRGGTDPDNAAWEGITSKDGDALSAIAASKLVVFSENPSFISPTIVDGDGTTAITITLTGI